MDVVRISYMHCQIIDAIRFFSLGWNSRTFFFCFFFNVQPTKGMHDQIIIKTLIVETNLGQQCEPVLSLEFN